MPKTKISDYSSTANDNSDINSINIAEGCAPSNINDAIREMMAQLKNYQAGLSGDTVSAVGSVIVKGTSATGGDIQLYEDTDNGTNYVAFKAPASISTNVTWTLPSADGTSGQAITTDGAGVLSFSSVLTASGTATLTNKTLTSPESTGAIYDNGSVRGNIVAVAALDIDCSAGNFFTKTINGNSTFTVSNVPASRSYAFTLELTHTSGTVTWFSGVEWPGGTAPTLTNGKTSLFVFVTDDGGTRWRGASLVDYTT